ncbi:LpxL/LpxP family acyltransferase [Paraglaciecola polaris]|nr:hypothetical protein [Paraglaciecola polaris]
MNKTQPHWSKIQENGTVLGIKTLLLVYQIFGRTIFNLVLFPVMAYYYLSNKPAREASKQYLSYLKPYLAGEKQPSSFRHFLQFGDMLLDKLLVWMGKLDLSSIEFKTPSVVEGISSSKRGALILVSHLGNIEVCNALRQKLAEVKLTILVNTQHAEKFNSLMNQLDSNTHAELLQVNELSPATAMMLSERIENGELIVIAGDRTPEHAGRISNVSFLGHKAPLPQGAFILASLLKCPVYLLFCLKQQNKYAIYVELFSERLIFSRKTRQQELDISIQKYARRLEHYCMEAPLQWYNFFSFWHKSTDNPSLKKTKM